MDSLQPSHLHSLLLCCLHQILMQNLDIQLWHHFCVGIGLITSAKHQLLASFVRSHLHRTSSSPTQKCRDLTRQHGRCCYQHGRVGQDWQQCHPWPKNLGPSGHQASGKPTLTSIFSSASAMRSCIIWRWKDASLVTTSSNHFHETWGRRACTSRWTLARSEPQPLWLERHQLVRSTALTSASGTSLLLILMNLTWPLWSSVEWSTS